MAVKRLQSEAAIEQRSPTVLAVGGDLQARDAMHALLRRAAWDLVHAVVEPGDHAFQMARILRPHLVLVDAETESAGETRRLLDLCRQSFASSFLALSYTEGCLSVEYVLLRDRQLGWTQVPMPVDAFRACKTVLTYWPSSGNVGTFLRRYLFVEEAKEVILRHQCGQPSLRAVAHRIGVSEAYLSRIFQDIEGERFTDYVTRQRVASVKKLLREPHLLIKEVAELAHFINADHFSRWFKKQTGQSPGAYQTKIVRREQR